jgi:hypothetical protein
MVYFGYETIWNLGLNFKDDSIFYLTEVKEVNLF